MKPLFIAILILCASVVYAGGGYYPEQQQMVAPTISTNLFARTEIIIALIGLAGTLGAAYIAHRRKK